MTRFLRNDKKTLIGETFEAEQIFMSAGTSFYEYTKETIGQGALQNPLGQNFTIQWNHNEHAEIYRVENLNVKFTIANADATNTPTFKNPWRLIDKIDYRINGGETKTVKQKEILLRVAEHLSSIPDSERFTEMLKWRKEIGSTLNGETVPASGELDMELDMFVVFPELKNYITRSPISQLSLNIFFISGTGNADVMTNFVVSNTTNDPLQPVDISMKDMHVERVLHKTNDPLLLKHQNSLAFIGSQFYEIVFENKSWNSVGVDKLIVNLKDNNAITFNKIQDVTIFIDKRRSGVAFNYVDSQKFYSGPNIVGFKIMRNNNTTLLDLTGSKKLHARRRYLMEFYKRRYGTQVPQALLDDSTLLSKYYMWGSRIDFSNIKTEFQDDYAVSGVSNATNEWSLELTCEGAVSATCDIYVFLHPFEKLL